MPSLKDLRNRINSVKSTQKITKAMQMVAAAKLRRAQTAAEAARPYATRMETVLANLATALAGETDADVLSTLRKPIDFLAHTLIPDAAPAAEDAFRSWLCATFEPPFAALGC